MKTKPERIRFSRSDADERLYKELKNRVGEYFRENKLSRYGDSRVLRKAVVFVLLIAAAYALLLSCKSYLPLQICYLAFGWLSLVCAFNFAHDGAHGALSPKAWVNELVYEVCFNFQGSNAYLWKIRHVHAHHPFPNVEGCDPDLDGNILLRMCPSQAWRPWHRYQHLYAPFLYTLYTLVWIFYKDFAFFFQKSHANMQFENGHPRMEFVKMLVYKCIYLGIFLGLPMYTSGIPAGQVVLAFLVMHFCISLFLLFTFLISHYVMEVEFPEYSNKGQLSRSWTMHQVDVSVDFYADKRWANFLFGGFNAHVAHHLFPNLCHIHYPAVSHIIQQFFVEKGITYKQVSYWGGVRSHLQLLRTLSQPQEEASKPSWIPFRLFHQG